MSRHLTTVIALVVLLVNHAAHGAQKPPAGEPHIGAMHLQSFPPLTYLHGEGQIVPGLESALEGLSAGDKKQVTVPPKDGYGEHDSRGVQEVDRTAFPPGFEATPGLELTAEGEDGEPVPFVIREVRGDKIVIDLNHPLAGKTLHFDVQVVEVKPPE